MTELPTIPVSLRVHLAHATLQAIAEECGADVLHIKGPAVDPSLRPNNRSSVDADVLVRPAHLKRYLDGLRRLGWTEVIGLPSGGLVEHSTNWYHGELGQVDVHIRFPGIQSAPEPAFSRLWEGRFVRNIANWPCTVPRLEVQRLIQLLHAARGLQERAVDVRSVWTDATALERDAVRSLASALEAEVALAAATGRLEEYRDRPEYDLWRYYADGEAPRSGFLSVPAAAKAAPAGFTRVPLRVGRYVLNYFLRMPRSLGRQLSRRPTIADFGRTYVRFLIRGLDAARRVVRR